MLFRSAALALALMVAPTLLAQGGDPTPVPKEEVKKIEQGGVEGGNGSGPSASTSDEPLFTEEEVREMIREEVKELRKKEGLLFSANGIDLWAGGGIEAEYRSNQEHSRAGSLPAPHRGGQDFNLDRAFLFVEGSFYDDLGATDMQLFTTRIELGLERDELSIEEAWIGFNRPLTRFDIPLFKEYLSDSIMIGLAKPFWANPHRVSEAHSLLDEALARDEAVQANWTFSAGGNFYLLGGVSGGSRLELDGEVDETRNFAILQDDRESYFDQRDDKNEVSDSLSWHFGTGMAFDLANRGEVIPRKRMWRPGDATKHLDVLHFGLWSSRGYLAPTEKTLIETIIGRPSEATSKWRAGATVDLVMAFDSHALYFRGQYAHAKDGDFSRNFTTLESSFAIDMGDAFPLLTVVQPYVRTSWLETSADGPVVSAATIAGSIDERAAFAAADRFQLTLGVSLWFHRQIALRIEYTRNNEEFSLPAGSENSLDNDVFLLNLNANF